jgi:hypothetical protein
MSRYQEREHWSDYKANRKRVCEIYEKDPNKVSCHHIVFRSDALRNPLFEDEDINQVSNLYPFANDEVAEELHTSKQDHDDLHQRLGRKEYERGTWKQGEAERKWKPKKPKRKPSRKKGGKRRW